MAELPPPASNSASDTPSNTAPVSSARGSGRGGLWTGIVALIAIAALVLAAWQAYSSRQEAEGLRQELAKRLAEFEVQSKAGRIAGDQVREAAREASVKIGVLESKLAESQSQQIALESLYQDLSRNRDEWAFAEIEQTLLVASQQLQLAGNVRAALIALQAADTRLAQMNRPPLVSLRKAISDDITRLKAAPVVDTVGLSVRIDTLIAAVDKLPLAADARAAQATPEDALELATSGMDKGALATAQGETAWTRFWRELWADVRQMVRVQRIDNADVPLLEPAQAYFLRENLKLRLLTARMALLTRDQATFRGDLKAAHAWITRYFDARDKAVAVALSSLAALQKSDVSIELPDLSATLGALRTVSPVTVRGKP